MKQAWKIHNATGKLDDVYNSKITEMVKESEDEVREATKETLTMEEFCTLLVDCRSCCAELKKWPSSQRNELTANSQQEARERANKLRERASQFWHRHQEELRKEQITVSSGYDIT